MMRKHVVTATLSLIALALAGGAAAQSPLSAEDQIEYRQAGYSFMSWNMGRIKSNLDGEFNAAQVQSAANAIAAIANSGMGALYGPGTAQGQTDTETRLKPELFDNLEEVGTIARNFTAAADALAKAAAGGDPAAVKTAFQDVGKSCKSCHDKFRAEDD